MPDVRTTTLPDAKTAPEAPPSPTHVAIRREDYRAPEWLVPEIELSFTLGIEKTRVQAKLSVARNPETAEHGNILRLNGDELQPLGVWIDGEPAGNWTMDGGICCSSSPATGTRSGSIRRSIPRQTRS